MMWPLISAVRCSLFSTSGEEENENKEVRTEIIRTWPLKSAILLVYLTMSIELTHFITYSSAAAHKI